MRTQLVYGLFADLLQDVRFLRVYWECIHDIVLTIIHAITFLGSVRRQDRVSNQSKVTLILMKRLLAICIVDFLASCLIELAGVEKIGEHANILNSCRKFV